MLALLAPSILASMAGVRDEVLECGFLRRVWIQRAYQRSLDPKLELWAPSVLASPLVSTFEIGVGS